VLVAEPDHGAVRTDLQAIVAQLEVRQGDDAVERPDARNAAFDEIRLLVVVKLVTMVKAAHQHILAQIILLEPRLDTLGVRCALRRRDRLAQQH